MGSNEEAKKAFEDWIEKRSNDITKKAQDDMDEIALCAKINLSAEIDRLKAGIELELPEFYSLIDVITGGGFVEAEEMEINYVSTLNVSVGGTSLFQKSRRDPIYLEEGKYKVILIIEKLEEE